jgi:hypothetical protein
MVFDVNGTNLLYVEPDVFRKDEIAFVNEHWHPRSSRSFLGSMTVLGDIIAGVYLYLLG